MKRINMRFEKALKEYNENAIKIRKTIKDLHEKKNKTERLNGLNNNE